MITVDLSTQLHNVLGVEQILDESKERALLLEEARNDLLFYTTVCNQNYIVSKVHVLMAKKLQAVVDGVIASKKAGKTLPGYPRRLIITVPPRTGKSQLTDVEATSFGLGKCPELEFAVASYSKLLPNERSRETRARLQDEVYQKIFKTRIGRGNSRVENWGTEEGGKYQAIGVGGGLTGRGADILLLDDLVRDFEEAHSEKKLDKAWNWFFSVAKTRLSPWGAIVIIMTRWSVDDIVGRLLDPKRIPAEDAPEFLKDERWEVINIKAIADDTGTDPLGRKPGESIFPERFPVSYYESIKATGLSYIWSALYEGSPVIMGGNYIPVAQIQIVDPVDVPPDLRWVRAWDLATGSKEVLDETAGIAGADGPDGTFYLKDLIHGRWDWPVARERIAQTAISERIPIGIEAVAGFKTAFQNLLEVLPPQLMCTEYGVSKDKLTRALPWIAMVAKKKVALVRGEWNVPFLIQAERFSGKSDDADDMLDGVSLVRQMLSGGLLLAPRPVNLGDRLQAARAYRRDRSLVG